MHRSALPHIYGDEFEAHKEKILASHGLPDVQYEILICTPRRWGKTTSVSMFIAAMLLEVEDMWIRYDNRASPDYESSAPFRALVSSEGDSLLIRGPGGGTPSCFSTGQRASSSLLDLAHKMICKKCDGGSLVLKKNQV